MILDENTQLTTNQAARLIHVHESSVKRWCKEGQLACNVTEGGHRRIELDDFLAFADDRNLACSLNAFSSDASEVWSGLREAQSKRNFDNMFLKAYTWLRKPEPDLFHRLMLFYLEQGITFSELFDSVIARALRQVGAEWQRNELDVGTEHYVTEIVRDVLHVIRQNLKEKEPVEGSPEKKEAVHRALIGCSTGNQHDVSVQAIRIILEQQGWETLYLGANVPVNDFANLQLRHKAQLMCVSFSSSNIDAEINRFIDVLARFYETDAPYHLVIGGSTFPLDVETRLTQPPFQDVTAYGSTFLFDQWLGHHSFSASV